MRFLKITEVWKPVVSLFSNGAFVFFWESVKFIPIVGGTVTFLAHVKEHWVSKTSFVLIKEAEFEAIVGGLEDILHEKIVC